MRHPVIPAPSPWSEFLAWPGGASLVYLVSAACLLAGAGLILAPAAGVEDRIAERLAMVGTMLAYTGALLGVACLVCHWSREHEDAVSLSVLLALFLVCAAAPLAVLTAQSPWLVAGLAAVILAGALGCAWLWQRRIGRTLPEPVVLGGVVLLVGAVATPVLVSAGIAVAGRSVPGDLLPWWQIGHGVTCLGLVVLWIGAVRYPTWSGWPRTSRLLSQGFPWVLALVVAVAAVAQSWLVSYTACLGFTLADLLLPVVLVLASLDVLGERRLAMTPGERLPFWILATLLPVSLLRSGAVDPWQVPLAHPALAAAVGALALGWSALRARHAGVAFLAVVWATLAVIGIGAWDEQPHLHLEYGGVLAVLGLAGLAAALRHPLLAVAAVVAGTLGAAWTWPIPGAVVMVGLGAQFLVLHLLFRQRLPTGVVVLGALLIGIGSASAGGGAGQAGLVGHWLASPWWPTVTAVLLGLPGFLRDRARRLALAPVALPGVVHLVPLLAQQPAWCAVGAAFALLGAGALLSRRTVGRPAPDRWEIEV